MKPARTFKDFLVWQKAHKFVLESYSFSKGFPKEELYGLTSQYRRASVSIAANIAEGFKKRGHKDKARFMNIAQGSLEECRYYLILAQGLGCESTQNLNDLLEEVSKMLSSYGRSILNS